MATESMVIVVVPLAAMAAALTGAVVTLPSTRRWSEAPERFNPVSGAAGVPALLLTTRVPAFRFTRLTPPPAKILPRTVPLATLTIPVTNEAFPPAAL